MIHSGLQVGGIPIKPGTQLQTACEFTFLQTLLGPQGDGRQGFFSTGPTSFYLVYTNTHEIFYNILSTRWQATKAFPANPGRQEHMGMWLKILHSAFVPQVPTQGSVHLFLRHALSFGQSLFNTHSGLHSR